MPKYLVLKRVKEDVISLPGEVLTDPSNVDLLIQRGYLIPVPDNYPGAVSKPSKTEVAPASEVLESLESEETPADSPTILEDELELDEEPETAPEPTTQRRPVARRK
jgi:hypothetical protein